MRIKRIRSDLESGSYVNYDPVALFAELITSAAPPPPRLGLAVVHAVAEAIWPAKDSPRVSPHSMRACVRAGMSRSLSDTVITFLQANKYPLSGGWHWCHVSSYS